MYDLHTHSTVSDGSLKPAELVRRAAERGVTVLALTDHDDVAGIAPATETARELGLRLVAGVEISVTWRFKTVHVVGLGLDTGNPALVAGLARIRESRVERAGRMALSLEKAGIPGALEGAMRYAGEQVISRTHFARFLMEVGKADTLRKIFKKYLVRGRPGYVSHQWAGLEEALGWIHGAGGQAVLAHPARYELGTSAMRALLTEFKELGGDALEVVSGSHSKDQNMVFADRCRQYGFMASVGSDYHGPDHNYYDLGQLPALPPDLVPVWKDW